MRCASGAQDWILALNASDGIPARLKVSPAGASPDMQEAQCKCEIVLLLLMAHR